MTRGSRGAYLEQALAILCGADAATVVNNNAAALVLVLEHFCRSVAPEVIISRGELLQIGGGFRIPEILEARGARLREAGTTNQTSVNDYARAINSQHRAHPESPSQQLLHGRLCRFAVDGGSRRAGAKEAVPFVEDLSGAIVQTETVEGVEHEPTPAEVVKRGVDLVCFSGDNCSAVRRPASSSAASG